MNLLQLPTEILFLILRQLGSAFFRHDTRRLLVSKSWYELVRLAVLQNLEFSAQSLQRFLMADSSSLVHQDTRTVKIAFDGFQDRKSVLAKSPIVRERVLSDWTTNVANNLTSLASILQGCRNLRSLKLKPRPEWRARSVMLRTSFSSETLLPLLSVGHLTCFEFDTVSTGIDDSTGRPRPHICEEISALLPMLRRLRCRMRKICPRILVPPADGALSSLEEVIINLNLGDLSPQAPPQHSYRCGIFVPGLFPKWKADMESGAKELVSRMATPRVVRVLSRPFSGPRMESWDALTQRRMILPPRAEWDADGEEVEETAANEAS